MAEKPNVIIYVCNSYIRRFILPCRSRGPLASMASPKGGDGTTDQRGRMVVCYVCGREFGTKSIGIHEPQCLSKWKTENNRLAENMRRPTPTKVDRSEMDFQTANKLAWEQSKQQLIACTGCGRRFQTDRIEAHENVCRKGNPEKPGAQQPTASTVLQKPKTVICYICGREYGTKSISIHEPQCLEKWHRENEQLPLKKRAKTPERPKALMPTCKTTSLSDYNEAARDTAQQNLVPCGRCGRKFNTDRVLVHERICKKLK